MNKGIFSLPTLEFEDITSGEYIVAELNMVHLIEKSKPSVEVGKYPQSPLLNSQKNSLNNNKNFQKIN
jgi:hypothetical protein